MVRDRSLNDVVLVEVRVGWRKCDSLTVEEILKLITSVTVCNWREVLRHALYLDNQIISLWLGICERVAISATSEVWDVVTVLNHKVVGQVLVVCHTVLHKVLQKHWFVSVRTVLVLDLIVEDWAFVSTVNLFWAFLGQYVLLSSIGVNLDPDTTCVSLKFVFVCNRISSTDIDNIISDEELSSIDGVKRVGAISALRKLNRFAGRISSVVMERIKDVDTDPVEKEAEADHSADTTCMGAVGARPQIGQRYSLGVAIVSFEEITTVWVEAHLFDWLIELLL